MNPSESIEAQLPPPRDDEPAGLRRAIIDELVDHLECAYRHELLRGLDAETARARALDRLGDPAALARRLWLDAMRGRIMRRRMLIVGAGTAMVAVVVFGWLSSYYLNVVLAHRLDASLRASQVANAQILDRLSEMSAALKNPRSPDWNPVRFDLIEDSDGAPPVSGAALSLTPANAGQGAAAVIARVSNAQGEADFGRVRPGVYELAIRRDFPAGTYQTQFTLDVQPGSEIARQLMCPKIPPDKAGVTVDCKSPSDFQEQGLVLYAPFVFSSLRLQAWDSTAGEQKIEWWPNLTAPPIPGASPNIVLNPLPIFIAVLVEPGGKTTLLREGHAPFLWRKGPSGENPYDPATPPRPIFADVSDGDREPVNLGGGSRPIGTYVLQSLIVLRPTTANDVPPGRRRYEVVAAVSGAAVPEIPNRPSTTPEGPDDRTLRGLVRFLFSSSSYLNGWKPLQRIQVLDPGGVLSLFPRSTTVRTKQIELPPFDHPEFELKRDEPNSWTIAVPEDLIKLVREKR